MINTLRMVKWLSGYEKDLLDVISFSDRKSLEADRSYWETNHNCDVRYFKLKEIE